MISPKRVPNLLIPALLAATTLAVPARADSSTQAPTPAIPATAQLIGQAYSFGESSGSTRAAAQADAVQSAEADLLKSETSLDVEFRCQAVYQKWAPTSFDPDGSYGCGILDGICVHYASVAVDIYCVPRTLVQQQMMSLEKTCESDPKPECFSSTYLDYLSKLEPTTYMDIGKPGE